MNNTIVKTEYKQKGASAEISHNYCFISQQTAREFTKIFLSHVEDAEEFKLEVRHG